LKTASKNLPAKNAKTGLYSRSKKTTRRRDLQRAYYTRRLIAAAPWIERQDALLLRRYVEISLLADVIYAHLKAVGPINPLGEARRLVGEFRKLSIASAGIGAQLGLSPSSRAGLKDLRSADAAIDISDSDAADAIAISAPSAAKHAEAGE